METQELRAGFGHGFGTFARSLTLIFTAVAALAGLAGAAWIGRADWYRQTSRERDIRRAMAMVPANWAYHRDLAELNPKVAVEELERAIALNPGNALLRLELGETAEREGDFGLAEKSLREGAAMDATSGPTAELAEFYYRRKNAAEFARSAKRALTIWGVGDLRGLFGEAWELLGDGERVEREVVPDRAAVWREYLQYLTGSGRVAAAGRALRKVMAGDKEAGKGAVGAYCDAALAAGDWRGAREAWEWLGGGENEDFGKPATGRGFDWHETETGGVYFERNGRGLTVSLTGKEPESCELLWEYRVLEPGKRYRLEADWDAPGKGLSWAAMVGGKDAMEDGEVEGPEGGALARLVLRYERVKGTVRVEGDARVRRVRLVAE